MIDNLHRPFFIVGCPKSGTTLLARMLNNHDSFNLRYDLAVASRFMGFYKSAHTDPFILTDVWNDPLNVHAKNLFSSNQFSQIATQFFIDLHMGLDMWDSELLRYKPKIWGSSEKGMIFYEEELRTWFPNVEFLYVLRDPRDVWASMKKARWVDVPWAQSVDAFTAVYRSHLKHKSERMKMIRYEDVIADPRKLFEILGLNLPEDYLKGIGEIYRYRTAQTESLGGQGDFIQDRRGRWKTELSTEEIERIQIDCVEVFEKGYYLAE